MPCECQTSWSQHHDLIVELVLSEVKVPLLQSERDITDNERQQKEAGQNRHWPVAQPPVGPPRWSGAPLGTEGGRLDGLLCLPAIAASPKVKKALRLNKQDTRLHLVTYVCIGLVVPRLALPLAPLFVPRSWRVPPFLSCSSLVPSFLPHPQFNSEPRPLPP